MLKIFTIFIHRIDTRGKYYNTCKKDSNSTLKKMSAWQIINGRWFLK